MTPILHGLDVSVWQSDVVWDLIDDVCVLGAAKATQGSTGVDPWFPSNWTEMRASTLRYRIAYHFLSATTTAEEQFANFKRALEPFLPLLPGEGIWADFENHEVNGVHYYVPPDVCLRFCELCETELGRTPMIYSNRWEPGFGELPLDRYPLWLADYSSTAIETGTSLGAVGVQYTSDGRLDGAAGRVDMNQILNFPTLDRLTGRNTMTPEQFARMLGEPDVVRVDDTRGVIQIRLGDGGWYDLAAVWSWTHGHAKSADQKPSAIASIAGFPTNITLKGTLS